MNAARVRGRYAPSPTGALHLGNVRTALLAWLQVRALGGALVMRIEDLDRARNISGATEGILEDLHWLGLDWDEGPDVGGPFAPYLQSEREAQYEDALRALAEKGLVYECWCSRAEIAAAASAPHGPSDEGPCYPGTCRQMSPEAVDAKRRAGRKPALRFRAEPGVSCFIDGVRGETVCDVAATVGDFVVRRADGIHAYQLAVAVDDALMQITHVLRGEDLLTSTPRQTQLLKALGLEVPRYFHVPLLMGPDGKRLSKRAGDTTLAWYRSQAVAPERIVAELARSCGLTEKHEITAHELIAGFDPQRLVPTPAPFDLESLRR
jgi:glutamyl-tRNA synthetase